MAHRRSPSKKSLKQILGKRPYVRGLGWGPCPSGSDGAESSRVAEERAALEREHQATREMVQTQQTQIGNLQLGSREILSALRATGAEIPESVTELLGIPPPSPPRDRQ